MGAHTTPVRKNIRCPVFRSPLFYRTSPLKHQIEVCRHFQELLKQENAKLKE